MFGHTIKLAESSEASYTRSNFKLGLVFTWRINLGHYRKKGDERVLDGFWRDSPASSRTNYNSIRLRSADALPEVGRGVGSMFGWW